jgi:LytS/YehU family sensor histidine kinase
MNKNTRNFLICQFAGWFSYALTVVFFAYLLEKQLSDIFLQRILLTVVFGIIATSLLRSTIIANHLRPPTASKHWWKFFVLVILTILIFAIVVGSLIEILRLFDVRNESQALNNNQFVLSYAEIVQNWDSERVAKRFLFSLIFDTPIFFVWISIYILWHYIEFTNMQAINKVKLEKIIKELELKTIKSQINPHFIFNALNSIRALVDEDPKRSRQAITELSNILRSSILIDKVEVTTLEKELAIVKDYLALEYIRFADRLKISYVIDDAVLAYQIPPMMLQTLVENAIKHGLGKQPGDCEIKLTVQKQAGKLVIEVQNTGHLDKSENIGFGLQSTKERLQILFAEEGSFELVQSVPNLVTAKLFIPIAS